MFEFLAKNILDRKHARLTAVHSPSKVRKWGSQRSPGIAFGWVTLCHAWRAHRVCDPPRIYATYCFRDTLPRGELYRGARFAPLPFSFSPPLSHSPSSEFAQFHGWALLCYCATASQDPTALRATDLGANVIIFRNLLSRCSLLWSRRLALLRFAGSLFSRSSAPSVPYSSHQDPWYFVSLGANFFTCETVQS